MLIHNYNNYIKLSLALFFCSFFAFANAQEICNNGIDDDGDGYIDCGDTECYGVSNCLDAFTCTSALYQVISKDLKQFDVASSSYTTIGSASSNYNGAGFNVQDGYLYGIKKNTSTYNLWRINNTGQETDLGTISNFGGINYVGDFDENGNLYTYSSGSSPKLYYVDVNANSLSSTAVTLTNNAGESIPGCSDITFNPLMKKFYGMSSSRKIVMLDPANLAADIIGDASSLISTSGGFGAAWSDSEGYLYFSNNNNGKIYRATLDGSGNMITTVEIATGVSTNSNDGMGCFQSAPPFETNCTDGIDNDGDGLVDCDDPDCGFESFCTNLDISVSVTSETGPGGVVSYHIFLTNNTVSDASGISVSDKMPTGFTYIGDTLDFDASGSFDGSLQPAWGATGTLTWGEITIAAGETIRIAYDAKISNNQLNGSYPNNVTVSGATSTGTHSVSVLIDAALTSNLSTFNCEKAFYQVYRKKGNSPNVYGKLDPTTGDYSEIATISHQANGLGFDIISNLAYGAVGKEFVSLDDEGVVVTQGLTFLKKVYVGDMDTLGYWYGKDGGHIKKVDVSTATLVTTYSNQGMPGWDMAYNKDGNFYAVHNQTLYKFDTSTGTKSTLGALTGSSVASGGFGAQWTGKDGDLYISHNNTGNIYRVNITTRKATFVLSSVSGLRYNDGFSCPLDISAVYSLDYSDLSGYPLATHINYAQDLSADDRPDYETVWLGAQVSEDSSNPSNAAGTGDSRDDGLTYPSAYRPGQTADFSIELTSNINNQEIHYGVWIDWDGDKTFEDFYKGSSTVTASKTVTQAVNVPVGFTGGNIAVRVRAAATTFSEANAAGELDLGEVEDYLIAATVSGQGVKEIACVRVNYSCDAPEISYGCDAPGSGSCLFNDNINNDLDNDGIPNAADPDPLDSNKQFVQCEPSSNSFGTLAYEDLWPQKGDYDFNDFVVEIKESIVTNQSNAIYQMVFSLRIMAMGGHYNNDFCIGIPDPNGTAEIKVFAEKNVRHVVEDAGAITIVKINKPKELLPISTNDIVNANSNGGYQNPIELQIIVEMNGELSYPGGYTPKFFIEGNGINGHEIHLAGVAPTSKLKSNLLGTVDDDSGNGKYYLSEDNLPWGIYIPTSWRYPLENIDLLEAYFRFDEFVESNPSLGWYIDDDAYRNGVKTFRDH